MITDRDPDDENDYPETDAQWIVWLRLQLARSYNAPRQTPEEFAAMLARPWGHARVLRAFPITGGPDQDPGDESDSAIYLHCVEMHITVGDTTARLAL